MRKPSAVLLAALAVLVGAAVAQDDRAPLPAPRTGQRCSVVQDALQNFAPEFATIVDRVIPLAAPPNEVWLFYDPNATITVLLPPRTHVNGILHAFDQNALKASEIWAIISLHVIPTLVTGEDLVRGEGLVIPTLNADGQQLTLSLSLSDTSGMGANSNAAPGTVGIVDADINACNRGSTMHSIASMLFPDDFLNPPEGQPRPLDAQDDDGGGGGMSSGAIAAIAIGLIACFLSCILGAACYKRRLRKEAEARKAGKSAAGKPADGGVAPEGPGKPYVSAPAALDMHSVSIATGSRMGSVVPQVGSDGGRLGGSSMDNTRETELRTSDGIGVTTFGLTAGATRAAPEAGASDDEVKAWVEWQLDGLGEMPVLQRFVMLGSAERRCGGQAVVQFARSVRDRGQYALKFFISRPSFDAESRFYTDSPLGKLLPRLEGLCDNLDGAVQDAQGNPLPPFVIMERGESLDEWSRRRKPDMWAAMPVLANIAKRLEDMHNAGYAHRDLKPGNVMWLPRENQWTLIDFGAAGRIGEEAPLTFTFAYAAPEVLAALHRGESSVAVSPAVDAWALGVMIFELLTGRPAFDVFMKGRDSVIAQILGQQPAPWDALSDVDRKKLGAFKGPVMELLRRDRSQRPSMMQFYANCNAIFSTSTTHVPGNGSPVVPLAPPPVVAAVTAAPPAAPLDTVKEAAPQPQ
eukprot:jgi/Ulvmu1/2347/UM013_0195.1